MKTPFQSAGEDPESSERLETLVAVESMLISLHGALATANQRMQIRFLREARMGTLRKPH
jgi:hypothetical protein